MYKQYRKLLDELIALKSISTDPSFKPEMLKTAGWIKQQFENHGFSVRMIEGANTNPVVVAGYNAGRSRTVLVYGHYDVQPAEMEQGWTGDPFIVREREGRLIGRGVVDNKGQVLIPMVSVFKHIASGTLGSNVLFMIEGNEETSNPDLPDLLAQYKDLLACDEILVSDGEIVGDTPTIDVSLRGGFNMRVAIRTAPNDMHSGLAGGAVPNAAQELVRLAVKLHNASGKVEMPGFYDGIIAPAAEVLYQHNILMKENPPEQSLGTKHLLSANGTDFYTQTGLYPTIQVSGIGSGYTGEGFANIVPAKAEMRLNVRTVAGQNTLRISQQLKSFIKTQTPHYAELEITVEGSHDPVRLEMTSPAFLRAQNILKEVYGKSPIMKYVGGAIPVVLDFNAVLGVAPLLVSLGNDDCRMHGPDENFRIDLIKKGLEFNRQFFAISGAGSGDTVE